MAPTGLRQRFLKLIDRERRRAEAGQPAEIVAKMNSLIDEEIIEALYAASQAGVKIRLNVRGICALRPGVPGVSDRHRGRLDRRSLPRALAHLLLPQRRRRGGLPGERRLDDAQSRQARRADVSGRGRRAQGQGAARAAGDVPRHRQGAVARRDGVYRRRAPGPASRRSGSRSTCRTRRDGWRRWRATAPACRFNPKKARGLGPGGSRAERVESTVSASLNGRGGQSP